MKVNEIPYAKCSFFINVLTGDFVNLLRVDLDKFAENEASKKKNSNKIINNKSDDNAISKKKRSIQTNKRIESEIDEDEKVEKQC